MRCLINQPLDLEEGQIVDFNVFETTYESYIEGLYESCTKKGIVGFSAKNVFNLCRAAVGGFAAKGDLNSISKVLDLFRPDATKLIKIVRIEALDRGISCRSCNILYLPDEDEKDVVGLLRHITKIEQRIVARGPRIIKYLKYVRSGWTPAWGHEAALHGLLLDLDREYPPSPFAG